MSKKSEKDVVAKMKFELMYSKVKTRGLGKRIAAGALAALVGLTAGKYASAPIGQVYAADQTYDLELGKDYVERAIEGESDKHDHKIVLTEPGWLTVDYQGEFIRDSVYYIYNEDKTVDLGHEGVYGSTKESPKHGSTTVALEKGTYFVTVEPHSNAYYRPGTYRIKASFKPASNNEDEPNDSFETAMDLDADKKLTGFLNVLDDADFYKINLPDDLKVKIACESKIRNAELSVYDSDRNEKGGHRISGDEDEPANVELELDLKKGTNYIKIEKEYWVDHSQGIYTLKWKAPVTSINIDGKKTAYVGRTTKLKATVKPENATNRTLKWKSSDPSVATVDNSGNVKGIKKGKVRITASATDDSGISATYDMNVENVLVQKVKISGTKTLEVGDSVELNAKVTPSDATTPKLIWKSSDKKIATVSNKGKVTAKKEGPVTITATTTDGTDIAATYKLTVKKKTTVEVTKIKITGDKTVKAGKSIVLKVSVTPDNATKKTVKWSSSDESVATVDKNGKVTAKKAGTVKITAAATDKSGVSATFKLNVEKPTAVSKITVSGEKTVRVGGNISLKAAVKPVDAAKKNVTWSSSDTSLATVDSKGKVTALKSGKVDIIATAKDGSGVSGIYRITVIGKNDDPAASKLVKKTESVGLKTKNKKKVNVSWTGQKNAIRYEIQSATDKKFTKNLVKTTATKNKFSINVTCKKTGKTYFRVRAVDKFGYVGKWSDVKNIKVK